MSEKEVKQEEVTIVDNHGIVREADGRWKKGYSANPKGRPKVGESYTDILAQMSEVQINEDPRSPKFKEFIAKKLIEKAVEGDISAIKYIIDRMDGKALASTKLSLDEDTIDSLSLNINVVKAKKEENK